MENIISTIKIQSIIRRFLIYRRELKPGGYLFYLANKKFKQLQTTSKININFGIKEIEKYIDLNKIYEPPNF